MKRVLVVLAALALGWLVWTWPRDAIPSFRTPCDTVACGGDFRGTDHPVFADSGTARFVRRVTPAAFWLSVALSPVGFLTVAGIRWAANRLHRGRSG